MISLTGCCDKCGRLMESAAFDPVSSEVPVLICKECYDRYYSLEAIRDKKLNSVLKKDGFIKRVIRRLNA
jgi:hypothetical protein